MKPALLFLACVAIGAASIGYYRTRANLGSALWVEYAAGYLRGRGGVEQ